MVFIIILQLKFLFVIFYSLRYNNNLMQLEDIILTPIKFSPKILIHSYSSKRDSLIRDFKTYITMI